MARCSVTSLVNMVLIAGTVCTAIPARAEFAILDLRTNAYNTSSANQLIGWEFTPTISIAVTKLGFFDQLQDGLAVSHDVGIFDVTTQSLLVSGLVGAGNAAPIEGPPVRLFAGPNIMGGFRYVNVPDTTLLAGRSYAIVGTNAGYADPTPDYGPSPGYLFQTASEISYLQGRTIFFGSAVLAFPTNATGSSDVASAFQFYVVPEPSGLIPFLLGSAMLAYGYRRNLRRHGRSDFVRGQ